MKKLSSPNNDSCSIIAWGRKGRKRCFRFETCRNVDYCLGV